MTDRINVGDMRTLLVDHEQRLQRLEQALAARQVPPQAAAVSQPAIETPTTQEEQAVPPAPSTKVQFPRFGK